MRSTWENPIPGLANAEICRYTGPGQIRRFTGMQRTLDRFSDLRFRGGRRRLGTKISHKCQIYRVPRCHQKSTPGDCHRLPGRNANPESQIPFPKIFQQEGRVDRSYLCQDCSIGHRVSSRKENQQRNPALLLLFARYSEKATTQEAIHQEELGEHG